MIGFVQEGKLVRNFQHAIERGPRIGGDFGRNDDLIDDTSFFEVFENPQQMGSINAEHRGAEASTVVEWDYEFIGILRFQAIHQMDFSANSKGTSGRRFGDLLDDVFRRSNGIGQLRDLPSAFRMGKHGNPWMFRAHLCDMRRKEPLMNRAMSFPEKNAAIAQLLFRIATKLFIGIPYRHFVESKSEAVSRVAAEMLVRKEQDLVASLLRPSHHRCRV